MPESDRLPDPRHWNQSYFRDISLEALVVSAAVFMAALLVIIAFFPPSLQTCCPPHSHVDWYTIIGDFGFALIIGCGWLRLMSED